MLPKVLQRHLLLVIVLLVVISRLPTLSFPILDIDEADFAVQTAVWMDGGIPYVDFVEKKTLLIHSWFRWIFEIFGVYNMTAVHLLDMLLILVTVMGVYLFARYTTGEKVARWAALLYAFFQCFYDLNDYLSTSTESLMNVFAIFGAFAFFKSMREDRPGMSLLAGALMGLSILAKQVGIVILAACFASLFWFWYEQKVHKWHRYAEEFFLLLVGVLFPIILHTVYLADAGGLNGFIRWTWFENLKYASSSVGAGAFILRGLSQGGKWLAASAVLWFLAGWAVAYFVRRRQWRVEIIFMVAWIICIVPAVSLGGRFFIHYFQQFLPPLVVLAAIGVVGRWEYFLRSRKISLARKRQLRVGAVILFLILPYIGFFTLHVKEVRGRKERSWPIRHIAAYVKSTTGPSDRIFVWGHDSDIYFFSDRKPASRFVYCSYLTGMKEGYERTGDAKAHDPDLNAWVMVKEDFKRHPPRAIIDLAPTDWRGYAAFPVNEQLFLANYLDEHYKLAKTVQGANIYVRKF